MKSLVHLFMTSILMLTQVSFAQRDKGEILVITPRNDTVIASGLVKINNAGNIVFREKKGGKKRTIDVQYVQRIEIAEGKNKGNYQKVETLENGTVLMKETVSGPIALFEEKIFENKTYYRSMPDGFGGSWNYTTGTSEVIQTNFYIYKNDYTTEFLSSYGKSNESKGAFINDLLGRLDGCDEFESAVRSGRFAMDVAKIIGFYVETCSID